MNGPLPSFYQGVKIVSYCPLCETQFKARHAEILDEAEDAQLVHLTCSGCKASVLAVIVLNNSGVTSVGLLSDLMSNEVIKFKSYESLSCDEVIDFHNTLETTPLEKLLNLE